MRIPRYDQPTPRQFPTERPEQPATTDPVQALKARQVAATAGHFQFGQSGWVDPLTGKSLKTIGEVYKDEILAKRMREAEALGALAKIDNARNAEARKARDYEAARQAAAWFNKKRRRQRLDDQQT
jgi:hypothetical protein